MHLSKEQKEQLKLWVTDSLSLSSIYKNISTEWKTPMTFMELKFLIDDLNLEFPEKKEIPTENSEQKGITDLNDLDLPNQVTMEIDKIMRPGAVISGSVTFSDGAKASWQLDQRGRIALIPSIESYRPSQEDIQEFEKQLQEALQKAGY